MSNRITAFDTEKAMAVILYVASKLPEERNLYKVLKAIYRATKTHLSLYGRQLFDETYRAMPYGTVPSHAYDITKSVRDKVWRHKVPRSANKHIAVSENDTISPLVAANLDVLSQTDIECLNEAIEFFRPMSFEEVKDNSHEDAAYNSVKLNAMVPLELIVIKTIPDGESLLAYLKNA